MCKDVGAAEDMRTGSRLRAAGIEGRALKSVGGRPITASVVARLSLDVLMDRPDPVGLSGGQVTYQAWQFHHLQAFADVAWWGDGRATRCSAGTRRRC